MKKLFVLMVVLAISSMATAATVTLQVEPGDVLTSYLPSTTITIELVGSGFDVSGSDPWNAWGGLAITSATSDNGGTASSPLVHDEFDGGLHYDGTIVNSGGVLINTVDGSVDSGDYDGIPNGDAGWSFEFHIPDVPHSTTITIDLTGLVIRDCWQETMGTTPTYVGALEIHVTPEPMTIALLGLGGLFLRRRK